MSKRIWLAFEFVAIYAGVPAAVILLLPNIFVLPILWVMAAILLFILWKDPAFECSHLWKCSGWRTASIIILIRAVLLGAAMAGLAVLFLPGKLFALPRTKPVLWSIMLLLYPLCSVVPQAIVYRVFLFHRYRDLLPLPGLFVLAAAAFSLAHLPFGNAWALGLPLIGAFMFNATYVKTKSMLLSSIEHAVFGALVFTLGFSEFFTRGTMHMASALGIE